MIESINFWMFLLTLVVLFGGMKFMHNITDETDNKNLTDQERINLEENRVRMLLGIVVPPLLASILVVLIWIAFKL
jgi:hypothetical protein